MTDTPNLRPIHKTVDKAAYVMAAFISLSKDGEAPPLSLIEEAEDSLRELSHWAESIKLAFEMEENESRH